LNVCTKLLVIPWTAYWTKTKIRIIERHKWYSKRTVWPGWIPNFFNSVQYNSSSLLLPDLRRPV